MNGVASDCSVARSARALRAVAAMLTTVLAALLFSVGTAHAAYGEYKVLLAEPYEQGAHTLGAQLAAFSEVKEISYVDTAKVTPTAAELARYDVVVSVGDSSYKNSAAWGNALAGYVDGGGVVVQSAYDTWDGISDGFGRFESGGYQALLPGNNANEAVELASVDSTSPLMAGVGPLTSIDNTDSAATPGASVVATWTNGANAVAVKGRVVDISAFLGDGYEAQEFTGDYGRIVFNAVRTLGPPPPAVVTPAPAPVVPPPPSNVITLGKLKLNKKKGTAMLTVNLPDAGSLVMSGKGVKKATAASTAAAAVKLSLHPVGKARKALNEKGKVKVNLKLVFTPTGGTAGTKLKTLTLRKTLR